MIQQLLREVADQIIHILRFHEVAHHLRNIRHTDDIPVIRLVPLVILLLFPVQKDVSIFGKNRIQRVQNFREHIVNPGILLVQQIVQVLVKFNHLLRAFHIGMQPVFIDLRFNICVLLLVFGYEGALGIAQLLVRLVSSRFNVARNPRQVLAERLDVGEEHLKQTEAFLGIDQTRDIEWTLLRMQEQPADLVRELPYNFTGQLLLRLNVFLAGPGEEILLQLGVHIDYLLLDHIVVAQAFTVLVARERLGYAGLKRLDHRIQVDAKLAGELLHVVLRWRFLEHFLHFAEQAESQISGHLLDRKDRGRGPDDVVFIVGRIQLVHLRNIRTNVADVVMDGKFLARLLLLTGHKVCNILRRDIHAVVIGILKQLAFSIRG
ncbi:hypothetical protein D3C86_695590 [compost metagenome]